MQGLAYTLAELQQQADRLREYLQPPSTVKSQHLAASDADLRLVSLLSGSLDGEPWSALDTAIQAEHNETISEIQHSETKLRDTISDTLARQGIMVGDDDDVTEALERLLAQVPRPTSVDEATSKPATEETDELRAWRIARACTQLLAEAEDAKAQADQAEKDPMAPIAALKRLASLVNEAPLRVPSSHELGRTMAILTDTRDQLLTTLETQYKAQLRTVLNDLHWPPPECQNPDKAHPHEKMDAYHLLGASDLERAWADLMELQLTAASLGLRPSPTCIHTPPTVSGIDEQQATPAAPGSDAYVSLLPVDVLMEPILLRFRYHFDSARPTNRLDKPEWFLTHILALVRMNAHLFEPAPDAWTRGGDIVELTRCRRGATPDAPMRQRSMAVDAPSELLHALLYPVRLKVQASMPRLVNERALLAHMIFQLITFDAELRDAYPPAVLVHGGLGAWSLADEVLSHDTWFQSWLDGERSFTESKFESVFEEPGAWSLVQADTMDGEDEELGEDPGASDSSTTTRCACTLMNVLAGVTERYQPLHLLEQKCAFIIQVQRPLLDQLLTRLTRHLDAFENMSTAFARTLPGEIASLSAGPGNDMVKGVNGVTRVAKALLSAEYIKQQLEEWSESSFFLHMAHELHHTDANSPLHRLMSPKSTGEQLDSASLLSLLHRGIQRGASAAASLRPLSLGANANADASLSSPTSVGEFGVWDQYIEKFGQVSARSAQALEKMTVAEVLDAMKPYVLRPWNRDPEVTGDEDEATASIPSPELVPALAKLTTLLQHLVQVLPPPLLLPTYRHIAASLSNAVVERILMPNARITQRFTQAQAERFRQDVEQGWLHVARELVDHPKIAARQRNNMPTGLGRHPETAWRLLVDAMQQLS
ncbi:hypothetical protein MEQU1_001609 [Malassezia equina]|uniref:TIP-1 family-domain-containing protein n=1 Tax=Malassezia equina TaxID=1381935 RepID=A0AAF0IZX1_9BASI|nr:hypothetical protein MEQU1_001609 [Malassezia equina]